MILSDGSRCDAVPLIGNYCPDHQAVLDRDVEVFKMLSEHFLQDVREFWTRSNFYLFIDSALVSIYISQERHGLDYMLGILGLVVSAFWYLVARGSIIWIKLWRAQVEALDDAVDRLRAFSQIEANAQVKPWDSPSWVTQWLPAAFFIGWVGLLIAT